MIWSALKLSLFVALLSTGIVAVAGLALAFLLARGRFWGRELLDAAVTLPLVLPPTVTGFYLIVLLGRGGFVGSRVYELTGWQITFTVWAAVAAAIVMSLPLMVKTARAAIEAVDGRCEMAARSLGAGKFRTFRLVTLPLAGRGVLAGVVLSFARALGEFGATLMLAGNIEGKTQTMPLAIYQAVFAGDDYQAQILALVLTVVSITAIYLTNKLAGSRAFKY